jgi:hypothetical protein
MLAVKEKAELVKAFRAQALVNDIERSRLFTYEQDTLPACDRPGNDVRNRLALSGPGRALHDEGLSLFRSLDTQPLGRVCVKDREVVAWHLHLIEIR